MNLLSKNMELEYLRARSNAIVNFMIKKNPEDLILNQYIEIIEKTFARKDLKGMRTIGRDVNAWAKALSQKDFIELDDLLKVQLGDDLTMDKISYKSISDVLQRGFIKSKEEYRMVYEYMQDVSEDDPFAGSRSEMEYLLKLFKI
ncbi:hypothetical protein [Algoriphagus sp.]|uniref:hypothetical protein n=1 Tax=Algoriphagus sp. TaxID=1872435 RepID=UPI003F6F33FD